MVAKLPDTIVHVDVPPFSCGTEVCPNCRQNVLHVFVHSCWQQSPPRSPVPVSVPRGCALFFTGVPKAEQRRRLTDTINMLMLSGWYYGALSWQGAQSLLKELSTGAFLIRDSGSKHNHFSLSVQTERGPTSVRLHFEGGFFRLDCDNALVKLMPRFRCVVELVQHYSSATAQAGGTVWVDRDGCPHSPVLLNTPLRKQPPSLMHSARLAIHRTLNSDLKPKLRNAPKYALLPLPTKLLQYIGEYPYSI